MHAYIGQGDGAGAWRGHLTYIPDVGEEAGELLKCANKIKHTQINKVILIYIPHPHCV